MAQTSSIHVYDHFDLYLTPVALTFNLPKNVSNGTSRPQGHQLCQTVLKSMHYCTSYGPDKPRRTHGCRHIHRTKIVTTMSRLPASGLDKNKDMRSSHSYTRLSMLTCSIILPTTIKIFLTVAELCCGNELLTPARRPTFIILITRVFHRKTWLIKQVGPEALNCSPE